MIQQDGESWSITKRRPQFSCLKYGKRVILCIVYVIRVDYVILKSQIIFTYRFPRRIVGNRTIMMANQVNQQFSTDPMTEVNVHFDIISI